MPETLDSQCGVAVNNDLEIEIDDNFEEMVALGAEMRRNGESYLAQLHYESEILRLEQKLADFSRAIAKVKNPDDPRLERAVKIMAQLAAELSACRCLFLKSWCPDRYRPN